MKKKPILIDCSLTGGRGPAKKTMELTQELKENNIPFLVLTDNAFKEKLIDVGVKIDYEVNVNLNDTPKLILEKFYDVISQIDYSFLVKLGARVAGP